jgi:hypothetical protein
MPGTNRLQACLLQIQGERGPVGVGLPAIVRLRCCLWCSTNRLQACLLQMQAERGPVGASLLANVRLR